MSEPYLSEEQQIALFHAVGRQLAAVVTRTRYKNLAEQIPDIAAVPLLGAFVSLKKDGELRSCMGTMSDEMPLAAAVEQAAVHAAKDDPRFPPITAAELNDLDLEIWLLWGMERVKERGEERVNAVQIGTHGIQISRGGNRGLLLPGVALEYGMDARTFLEAVCRKAGLPTDAWLDDRSLLHRFEGRAISGPLNATENIDKHIEDEIKFAAKFDRGAVESPLNITPSDLDEIRRVCMETFQGMADGVSPANYYPGIFDGKVSGITVTLLLPEREPLGVSRVSVRPDVQFQDTLIILLKVLGREVEKFGVTPQELYEAVIDVSIFHEPAIHGNASRHDLKRTDTAYRSIMISSPQGWVLQYDPEKDAEMLVKESLEFMELPDPDLGEIISLETISTTPKVFLSSISKPPRKDEVRPAAVAGAFYPVNVNEMNAELDRMLSGTQTADKKEVKAVLVPHAGWLYSGALAAKVLAGVKIPKRVIIFAPQHRSNNGMDWAVAPCQTWLLPGRNVETDLPFADAMTNAVKYFSFDARAHVQEHSIEVQLPLLARLAPQTKIIAVAMRGVNWQQIQSGAAQLAAFLTLFVKNTGLDEMPLFIISSDMNHFANEETTRRVDRSALNAVKKAVQDKMPEYALNFVNENQISMCGIYPAVFVMETLRCLGTLDSISEVGYTTSAESSGDTQRVVGYAGLVFN